MRLITARSSARRNSRGRGLPACGRGVIEPTSAKPKPSPSSASGTSPSLSKPAAMPSGLGKARPGDAVAAGRAGPRARRRRGPQRRDRQAVRALGVEREQRGPGKAVEHHAAAMAAPRRAVDRSILIVSIDNYPALSDILCLNGACRFPTSRPAANWLTGACDPKGSKQRCNEFSTFKGGSVRGPPLFWRLKAALFEIRALRA